MKLDRSRVLNAASACLAVSGLIIGGAGGALALADPGDSGDQQSSDTSGDVKDRQDPVTKDPQDPVTKDRQDPVTKDPQDPVTKDRQDPVTKDRQDPSTKPEDPSTKPEDPSTKPEDPSTKPEDPSTKPEDPSTKPDEPPTETPCPDLPRCPEPPGEPSPPGGDGDGGAVDVPNGRPDPPPTMQLPPPRVEAVPGIPVPPPVIAAVPGGAGAVAGLPLAGGTGSAAGIPLAGAAAVPLTPITLPVVVGPSIGLGGPVAPGAPTRPTLPGAPQPDTTGPSAGREPLPANIDINVAVPASFRVGYGEYLRAAGPSQLVALVVPGVAGILALTGVGGFVGYRQAKAGHIVRTGGAARFVA